MLRHLVVVVKALVKVGLAIAVQIVEFYNLVAAADKDGPVSNLQPKGLEQARCDPLPCQAFRWLVDSTDRPHIAVPSTNGHSLAIWQEVEPAQAKEGIPRVSVRGAESVHGKRTVLLS